jgi:hypothetical protein
MSNSFENHKKKIIKEIHDGLLKFKIKKRSKLIKNN